MNFAQEAQLIYTLLDAAEDEHRFHNLPLGEKWQALKRRCDNFHCKNEHGALKAFFEELDRTDALAGTWIQFRWSLATAREPRGGSFRKPRLHNIRSRQKK
jgi:hypothetical protein